MFLHGTRLSRSMWWPQLRRLSGRYRCIAVDLPGHGVLADEPFTIEGAVATVRAAIEAEVPTGRAVLVGLSLGGFLAIDTAEAYPDMVAGLVLADCSAEPFGPIGLLFRMVAAGLERTPGRLFQMANRWYFRLRYRRSTAEPVIEGGFWPRGGAEGVRVLVGRRYLERLGRLWTRVLVVNGALDPVFGPQGEYWAASCRAGRQAVVAHATHLANLDQPTTFARLVADFTDEVTPAA